MDLVASSVYDTKPVHYLSMVCDKIKWMEVDKNVYNVDENQIKNLKFLQMNNINNYNHTMGDVDWADQLCVNYHMDHWIQKHK